MSLWGSQMCPKLSMCCLIPFNKPRTRANLRIGPHDKHIFSVIFGSLLGDSFAEKHGNGTRIVFQQEESNMEYLMWFHSFLAEKGYCNPNKPKIQKRIGINNKIRFYYRFKTWTFTSFNWIRNVFYPDNQIKIVPLCLSEYLTPLALAIWIMDDGTPVSKGLKFCTHSFSQTDILFLKQILKEKYNLKTNLHKDRKHFVLYVYKESMSDLSNLVRPYIVRSMSKKLNGY